MGAFVSLAGRTFGRLAVTDKFVRRPYKPGGQNRTFWVCTCSCGGSKEIGSQQLLSGRAGSCGCVRSEKSAARRRTHGGSKSREHLIWKAMRQRCLNSKCPAYANYGGRGIKVCERWHSFAMFLADMGRAPDGLTIERVNNDGPYSPDNCRWATRAEQTRNTRKNRFLTHDGRTLHVSEWARVVGIQRTTIEGRLKRGRTVHDALTVPVLRWPKR